MYTTAQYRVFETNETMPALLQDVKKLAPPPSQEAKADVWFDHLEKEFGAETLWFGSTHEYYKYTKDELQTPLPTGNQTSTLTSWEGGGG